MDLPVRNEAEGTPKTDACGASAQMVPGKIPHSPRLLERPASHFHLERENLNLARLRDFAGVSLPDGGLPPESSPLDEMPEIPFRAVPSDATFGPFPELLSPLATECTLFETSIDGYFGDWTSRPGSNFYNSTESGLSFSSLNSDDDGDGWDYAARAGPERPDEWTQVPLSTSAPLPQMMAPSAKSPPCADPSRMSRSIGWIGINVADLPSLTGSWDKSQGKRRMRRRKSFSGGRLSGLDGFAMPKLAALALEAKRAVALERTFG